VKKTVDLAVMWINTPESMIQDEGDRIAKQETSEDER